MAGCPSSRGSLFGLVAEERTEEVAERSERAADKGGRCRREHAAVERAGLRRLGAAQKRQVRNARACGRRETAGRRIDRGHRDTGRWRTEAERRFAHRIRHEMHPRGKRRLCGRKPDTLRLVKADPYTAYEAARVADEVGVAIVVGRAGFTRGREVESHPRGARSRPPLQDALKRARHYIRDSAAHQALRFGPMLIDDMAAAVKHRLDCVGWTLDSAVRKDLVDRG